MLGAIRFFLQEDDGARILATWPEGSGNPSAVPLPDSKADSQSRLPGQGEGVLVEYAGY